MGGTSSVGDAFAAKILEQGASGLAGYAASALLEAHPDIESRYGAAAHTLWQSHLRQRILELAAAVESGESKLFVSRVGWAREAFLAREQGDGDLGHSLQALTTVLEEHLPEPARALPLKFLEEAHRALTSPRSEVEENLLDPGDRLQRQTLRYLQTILDGHPHRAIDELVEFAREEGSPLDVYVDVLLPAQREVGRLWHLGQTNIAEEHLVTSTTQRAMAALVHAAPPVQSNGKTVVAAAVAGDDHDIGLRAVSDAYELSGWRTLFLGRNMPARDLVLALDFFEADLLLLTATLSTHLSSVRPYDRSDPRSLWPPGQDSRGRDRLRRVSRSRQEDRCGRAGPGHPAGTARWGGTGGVVVDPSSEESARGFLSFDARLTATPIYSTLSLI